MRYAILLIAIVSALFCRAFLVSVYKVSSQSMAPTLLAGDYVFASRISYGIKLPGFSETIFSVKPNRGDMVVFQKNSKIYIKRVLAVAHDEIEYRNGDYLINSIPCEYALNDDSRDKIEDNSFRVFSEKCAGEAHKVIRPTEQINTPPFLKTKLKESQVFVVSDFRSYEGDLSLAEAISTDQIIGKPLFVWMSYASTQDFISKTLGVRWNRIMTKL